MALALGCTVRSYVLFLPVRVLCVLCLSGPGVGKQFSTITVLMERRRCTRRSSAQTTTPHAASYRTQRRPNEPCTFYDGSGTRVTSSTWARSRLAKCRATSSCGGPRHAPLHAGDPQGLREMVPRRRSVNTRPCRTTRERDNATAPALNFITDDLGAKHDARHVYARSVFR